MSQLQIERYGPDDRARWDHFVRRSKNATFLFRRGYMDYHRDRFDDHSLVLARGDRVVALLPASEDSDQIVSHGGLTFGGVLSDRSMTTRTMLECLQAIRLYYRERGFRRLLYKAIPHIYHVLPAEEDLYALFRLGGRLVRRDVSATLVMEHRGPLTKGRKSAVKKSARAGLEVGPADDFAAFMAVEERLLESKYGARPVHSAVEIERLAAQFPQHIRLFCARRDGEILAGTIIYESRRVAHAQYIASTEEGRVLGALDRLFSYLLDEVYADKPCFDFGISTTDSGRSLNVGLAQNKESWGARATVYDHYRLELADRGTRP